MGVGGQRFGIRALPHVTAGESAPTAMNVDTDGATSGHPGGWPDANSVESS